MYLRNSKRFIIIFVIFIIVLVVYLSFLSCDFISNFSFTRYSNGKKYHPSYYKFPRDYQYFTIYEKLKSIIKCHDKYIEPKIIKHSNYWILENYITANYNVRCFESLTYTTQGDYTFLDNIVPLLKRWQAPLSVAIYAPGTDYDKTIKTINYLRKCDSNYLLVRKFATFHIFFDANSIPTNVHNQTVLQQMLINCNELSPFLTDKINETYRKKNNLVYPINVARNIARKLAQTYFVIASDIELYPSENLAEKFLKMISNDPGLLDKNKRNVFVLAVFEIDESAEELPTTKTELQILIEQKKVFPFHKNICDECHHWPKQTEWISSPETMDIEIFTTTKRINKFSLWEPFYIGTNNDPDFDERISWENKRDKMVQAYILCVQDYDFLILDNVFLMHKFGIKKSSNITTLIESQTEFILNEIILPEYNILYGKRDECKII